MRRRNVIFDIDEVRLVGLCKIVLI